MGAGQGTALRLIDNEVQLLRETREFARWTLDDVVQLHRRFQKTFGLALTESDLERLLLRPVTARISTRELFCVLDTNRDGRLDGLEFLAALLFVCRACFEDKAQFAFELFDFNGNGSLSLTELALLMKSAWAGMSLLTGQPLDSSTSNSATITSGSSGGGRDASSFLSLAQHAFQRFDRDGGASLQYDEFIAWARTNRAFMLQIEQFRLIAERAMGGSELASSLALALPDGSDDDSDLDEEERLLGQQGAVPASPLPATTKHTPSPSPVPSTPLLAKNDSLRRAELPPPWLLEPSSRRSLSSQHSDSHAFPPPVNMQLEWIYGYPGAQARDAVRFLASGELVYIVSKYAVVYSSECHAQRHYSGHASHLSCIATDASALIVATGDDAGEIHVWHGGSLERLVVLRVGANDVGVGVARLAFSAPATGAKLPHHHHQQPTQRQATYAGGSASGTGEGTIHGAAESLLLSVANDHHGSMSLWNWPQARLLASTRALPPHSCHGDAQYPQQRSRRIRSIAMSEDGHELLVVGDRILAFFHVNGCVLKPKPPRALEKHLKTMHMCVSAAYYGLHHAVVGTARGQLLLFQSMELVRVVQAHALGQTVNVCTLSCRAMLLFTAGKDGIVRQWDSTLHPIGSPLDLHQHPTMANDGHTLQDEDFRVHSLAYDAVKQRLVVGTRRGHLLEIQEADPLQRAPSSSSSEAAAFGLASSSPVRMRVIAASHRGASGGQVLATCRSGVCVATCSAADSAVRLWNLRRRTQEDDSVLKLPFPPSALCYSVDGAFIAVGGHEGSVALLCVNKKPIQQRQDYQSMGPTHTVLSLLSQMKNSSSQVTSVRFQPRSDTSSSSAKLSLAVARANGIIYVYTIENTTNCWRFHRSALLSPRTGCEDSTTTRNQTATDTSMAIRALDFSIDGRFLRSQQGMRALRFWDLGVPGGERVTRLAKLCDVEWHTFSATIGWHVQGVPSSVRPWCSSDLIGPSCLSVNDARTLVASLDGATGNVMVHTFPCALSSMDGSPALARLMGHAHLPASVSARASAAMRTIPRNIQGGGAGFAVHDSFLVTTSGTVGSVLCQWQVIPQPHDPQPRHAMPSIHSEAMWHLLSTLSQDELYYYNPDDVINPEITIATSSQQTTPMSTMVPTVQQHGQRHHQRTEAPDLDLSLAFVHGFNYTQNALNQTLSALDTSIVHGAGTLIVHRDATTNSEGQTLAIVNSGLTQAITSIVRISPHILAIGARGDPRVLLWQCSSGSSSSSSSAPFLQQSIGALLAPPTFGEPPPLHVLTAFAANDQSLNELAAVVWKHAHSSRHELVFYDRRDQQQFISPPAATNPVQDHDDHRLNSRSYLARADMTLLPVFFGFFASGWSSSNPITLQPPSSSTPFSLTDSVGFVSGGVNHVTFWTFSASSRHMTSEAGVFGRHALCEPALCGVETPPFVLTGMCSGSIIVWEHSVAAFSLPLVDATSPPLQLGSNHDTPRDTMKNSVISLVAILSRRQVVVAIRSGRIVLLAMPSRQMDPARVRANTFLQVVRAMAIWDDCKWTRIQPLHSSKEDAQREHDGNDALSSNAASKLGHSDGVWVRMMTVLDELQNGVVVVLSSGIVAQLDASALLSTAATAPAPAPLLHVIVDIGTAITSIALHSTVNTIALGHANGYVSVHDLDAHDRLVCETHVLTASVEAIAWQHQSYQDKKRVNSIREVTGVLAISLGDGTLTMLHGHTLQRLMIPMPCGRDTTAASAAGELSIQRWCRVLAFSPSSSADAANPEVLAAACRDFHIYVYQCEIDTEKLRSTGPSADEVTGVGQVTMTLLHDFVGHTAPVTALDFSLDAQWLQSSTSSMDCQLMRWRLNISPKGDTDAQNTGKSLQTTEASQGNESRMLSDSVWATRHTTFSGPVAGLSERFGSRVTCVSRIHSVGDDHSSDQVHLSEAHTIEASTRWKSDLPTIAIGTARGEIMLGWYPLPCGTIQNVLFKEYQGFLPSDSPVVDIAFSPGNEYVVSLSFAGNTSSISGGNHGNVDSGVVLVWRTDFAEEMQVVARMQRQDPAVHTATPAHENPQVIVVPDSETLDAIEAGADENRTDCIVREAKQSRLALMLQAGDSGDEHMAVKPWLGAIREPSSYRSSSHSDQSRPVDSDLTLDFVYGINTSVTCTHTSVGYGGDGHASIVYSAASFGVSYSPATRLQVINTAHRSQCVISMAIHWRGDLVATGELAEGRKAPRVVVWDSRSARTIAQTATIHTQGLAWLAFASSGERIASIGLDVEHTLAVYALRHGDGAARLTLLASMKTTRQPVYALCFHDESDNELVTAGARHVLFWTMAPNGSTGSGTTRNANNQRTSHGRSHGAYHSTGNRMPSGATGSTTTRSSVASLSAKKGLFAIRDGAAGSDKVFAAVYVASHQQPSRVITAHEDGSLHAWKARQRVETRGDAHRGAIFALAIDRERVGVFYSGGQDGRVVAWSAQMDMLLQVDTAELGLSSNAPELRLNPVIKGLAVRGDRVLVATDGREIAELVPSGDGFQSFPTRNTTMGANANAMVATSDMPTALRAPYQVVVHVMGHGRGELWGLAVHPFKLCFLSAGDDASVRLWNAPTHELLASFQSPHRGVHFRAAAFSSDGGHVALGSEDGDVLVLTELLDTVVTRWKCCSRAIAVLKFDPTGRLLAVGTHDQRIYMYDAHTYAPRGICRGHSATVSHLDFSKDGRVLQSSSNAGELLFWSMPSDDANGSEGGGRLVAPIKSASSVRDVVWASWTLPYGWPVQGIWPLGSDGSDVNAVCRSQEGTVLATGDDCGLVKLFRYPCVPSHKSGASDMAAQTFEGHASHVTNCCFSRDDHYLYTTGGLDTTICQYAFSTRSQRSSSEAAAPS